MSKTLELALTGLVPTLNGPIPPELLDLASSLLAQSRTKVSSLRAEEETARAYTCANLACERQRLIRGDERLKQTLNLPKIEPRPPCPPRVYRKLYKYFETTLLPPRPRGRPPNTPNKNTVTASAPSSARQSPRTPSKQQRQSRQGPTPQKPIFTPNKPPVATKPITPTVPPWVSPSISHLCTKLLAPAAIPHILDGVTTILTQPSPFLSNAKTAPPEDKKDKIPALIIAVYFFVTTRLSNRETTGSEYVRQRKAAMATMDANPRVWDSDEHFETKDVDAWLKEISDRGWLRLDWFNDVPEGAGLSLEMPEDDELPEGAVEAPVPILKAGHVSSGKRPSRASSTRNVSDNYNNSTLHIGLGTMMQDRVDYLSKEKRLDFLDWKRGIMNRIEALEQQQGTPDGMDLPNWINS
ncbi:hypothetical protein FGG08_000374 [Glutinoglossum americanum]|uniref:ORC6 first cyclin-like domain-containing protein n=1 Tax=Glutinoglossum americanum TaxID=1670608 RepID=A0A9P8II82_9PEZI|nr:hypothetical protein FGG08_000374 [Glutinoglossum americanum]